MYKSILNRLFTLGFLFSIGSVFAQNIYTFAGIGTSGNTGDGGAALSAEFGGVTGVATDIFGNVYICDGTYGRIRKVDVNGFITTIGGGGSSLSDGILATSALISNPKGITTDRVGNIYFAENDYNQVRKINTAGIITTVAGIPNTSGGFSGDGGLATMALLKRVFDVAVDTLGNIYISDCVNNRIRMVNTSGIINTVVGSNSGVLGDGGPATSAQLYSPLGIDVDINGNIYVCDYSHYSVRKIDVSGIITTIAGTGVQGNSGDGSLATLAEIGGPYGVKVDNSGNIYIGDFYYGTIRKINTSGIISTVVGTGLPGYSGDGGAATLAQIDPFNLDIDTTTNDIYIADGANHRVRKVCNGSCVQGVNEINKKQQISVYPNPTTNILNISGENNTFENSTIEVANYLGQTILKQVYSSTVDVSKLPSGIYALKITTSNKQSYYSKFIKE